ncbi:MAG: endoribonuclease [Bacteroidetes bacterium]|nr:endoribonuclease [Bacteroidota bacterium]
MSDRSVVSTPSAPAAIGPYSQAVVVPPLVFTAGQIAIVPATGALAGDDIRTQTRQVLENVSAILRAAGTSLDRVVKTTVFVKDMGEFQAMNEVYAEFFPSSPPARSTVEVARLPRDVRVEIEAIAVVNR